MGMNPSVAALVVRDLQPAARRLFEKHFAGIRFIELHASRVEFGWIRNTHSLWFQGPIDRLLAYGLIDETMIPPQGKRIKRPSDRGDDVEPWVAMRAARGELKVLRAFNDRTPASHPLSMFGIHNWPFTDAPIDARQHRIAKLCDRLLKIPFTVRIIVLDEISRAAKNDLRMSQQDKEYIDGLVNSFEAGLENLTSRLSCEPVNARRNSLRLIVNDGVLVQP
jgi:hypothetical protein